MTKVGTGALTQDRCSTRDLLNAYDSMGIPHFQRGLVWDDSSVALLLESLFFETPCGSLLLWEPKNVTDLGVPFGTAPRYLIVDGQQRIRSLHGALSDTAEDGDESLPGHLDDDEQREAEDEGETHGRTVWCLNLGALPEFRHEFPAAARFKLFRKVHNPQACDGAQPAALQTDRRALIPLKWVYTRSDEELRRDAALKDVARTIGPALRQVLAHEHTLKRLRGILTYNAFTISFMRRDLTLPEVTAIYNRINSAGKRVEAEERVFASLSAACPQTNDFLSEFYRVVHPPADSNCGKTSVLVLSRDGALQRQRESRFGFRLFMRAFVIGLAYHSERSLGSDSFSFDAARPDRLTEAASNLPAILSSAVGVLVATASILRETLYCDDLRMLPDTTRLWPVLQLLTRYRGIESTDRQALASVALRLMLTKLKKSDMLKLCSGINGTQSAHDAFALLGRKLTADAVRQSIEAGVADADSIQARYTLLLYWLLRREGAQDFSYEKNLTREKASVLRRRHGGHRAALSEAVAPEKQHIVPYKTLKRLFDLDGGARPGRHPVNDIGNLTYISRGLNSVITGVGSKALKLDDEEENAARHMLTPEGLALYRRIVNMSTDDFDAAQELYTQFCIVRREAICGRLIAWDLAQAAHGPIVGDVAPSKRLLRPGVDDRIRAFNYSPEITQMLIVLCDKKGVREDNRTDGGVFFAFKGSHGPAAGKQLVRIDLPRPGRNILLKFSRFLRSDFARAFPAVVLRPGKRAVPNNCRFSTSGNDVQQLIAVLRWLAPRVETVRGKRT